MSLTDRLRSSFTISLTLAKAISGTNPPEGCPSWTFCRAPSSASSLARNLMRVPSQLYPFDPEFLFKGLVGSCLRPSLTDFLIRWGPDEEGTGWGSGISGAAASYGICQRQHSRSRSTDVPCVGRKRVYQDIGSWAGGIDGYAVAILDRGW